MSKPLVNIWIAVVGEPIPLDSKEERLLRSCQFAQWLSEKGHNVTFITNSVDHYRRRQRCKNNVEIAHANNFKIVLLWTRVYQRSVSIRRFLSHRDIIKSFSKWAKSTESQPDIIIVGYPTLELSKELVNHGRRYGVHTYIDCRDAWPDIFIERIPAFLKAPYSFIYSYQSWLAKRVLEKANGLFAQSDEFLEWAVDKAGRKKVRSDRVFHFTYTMADSYRLETGNSTEKSIRLFFAGTLTRRNGLDAFLGAFTKSATAERRIELRIAGTGDDEVRLRDVCDKKDLDVAFLGWLTKEELAKELYAADYGLLPYLAWDFKMSLPNKFTEYIAHGLPIICVGDSAAGRLVQAWDCGFGVDAEADSIADNLHLTLRQINYKEQRKQSANARALFEKKFEEQIVFQAMERHLLEELSVSQQDN